MFACQKISSTIRDPVYIIYIQTAGYTPGTQLSHNNYLFNNFNVEGTISTKNSALP